jgi:TonB-dependent receptor-like protein
MMRRVSTNPLFGWSMRLHIRAAIALLGAVVSPLSGQTPDSAPKAPTRIIGVFDARTGEPLPGVQVRDSVTGTYAVTTATGTAPLTFLTFRRALAVVELRKLGYQPKQIVVKLADSAITETLEPVVTLAPVVTTAKYRIDRDEGRWDGFNQRCLSKSVTCIRNEDLEKRPSANIADFLLHAEGVTMGTCGGGSQRNGQCGRIAMRPTVIPPSFCQPTFFVDGFEWNSRMGAPTDLAPHRPAQGPYTPTNVKAIEVYPPGKTRPLRFEGDPLCGAVVIWTK